MMPFKRVFFYVFMLLSTLNGYSQYKFSKRFANDVLSNEHNFIVLNVKFNNEYKIAIATLTEVAGLFENIQESEFKGVMINAILHNDTLTMNKDSLSHFENRFFNLSELRKFSSGQHLNTLIIDKKKCYVKNSFVKKIAYRDIDWFRLIYGLWNKQVVCKEDDETGFLSISCKNIQSKK